MALSVYSLTGEAYHHTVGDIDTLQQLVATCPVNPVIVNIGACFGTSTLAMLAARPGAFIFSIDIAVCPKEREHIEQAQYDWRRVVRILGPSQWVGIHWPHPVDMVFVDGAHDYDGVRKDIVAWRPKVKANGILAFHDYGAPSLPQVKQAIDDEMRQYEPFLHAGTILAYVM